MPAATGATAGRRGARWWIPKRDSRLPAGISMSPATHHGAHPLDLQRVRIAHRSASLRGGTVVRRRGCIAKQ